MTKSKLFITATGLLTVAAVGLLTAPKVRAAIKAAYVEVVIPSRPFQGTMDPPTNGNMVATGSNSGGTLGVTAITLTNYNSTVQTVYVFNATITGNYCEAPTSISGFTPGIAVMVPAHQTLHLPFPTPMVFPQSGSTTCVGAYISTSGNPTSTVEVSVNGFVN